MVLRNFKLSILMFLVFLLALTVRLEAMASSTEKTKSLNTAAKNTQELPRAYTDSDKHAGERLLLNMLSIVQVNINPRLLRGEIAPFISYFRSSMLENIKLRKPLISDQVQLQQLLAALPPEVLLYYAELVQQAQQQISRSPRLVPKMVSGSLLEQGLDQARRLTLGLKPLTNKLDEKELILWIAAFNTYSELNEYLRPLFDWIETLGGVSDHTRQYVSLQERFIRTVRKKNLADVMVLTQQVQPQLIQEDFTEGLWLAFKNNDQPMMTFLLEKDADPLPILNNAIIQDASEQHLLFLLNQVKNTVIKSTDINDIFMLAISHSQLELVKSLLNRGVNVHTKNTQGGSDTAIEIAIKLEKLDIAKLLLKHGANPNTKSEIFGTLIERAVNNKKNDMVQMLLVAGANPNTFNSSNEPIILIAVENNDSAMVELLLKAGAKPDNINSKASYFDIPIFEAIENDNLLILQMLLQHGANANQRVSGDTPLTVAKKRNDPEIVKILKKYGAK